MKTQVEKLLEEADKILKEAYQDKTMYSLPDPNDTHSDYKSEYQKLRGILYKRIKLGFANGVYHSVSAMMIDEILKTNQKFFMGEGI